MSDQLWGGGSGRGDRFVSRLSGCESLSPGATPPLRRRLATRLRVFNANVAKINSHNAGGHSWSMGLNAFADLTAAEFKQMHAMKAMKASPLAPRRHPAAGARLPLLCC